MRLPYLLTNLIEKLILINKFKKMNYFPIKRFQILAIPFPLILLPVNIFLQSSSVRSFEFSFLINSISKAPVKLNSLISKLIPQRSSRIKEKYW